MPPTTTYRIAEAEHSYQTTDPELAEEYSRAGLRVYAVTEQNVDPEEELARAEIAAEAELDRRRDSHRENRVSRRRPTR